MDANVRALFNGVYTDELYARYRKILDDSIGPFPFRVAETPLFLDERLRKHLEKAALEIIAQLSDETKLAKMRKAIPAHYDAPGMSALPDCVQVDFGLCKGANGEIVGRVVELQAFPSLSAMEIVEADAWENVFRSIPSLAGDWSCFFSGDRE